MARPTACAKPPTSGLYWLKVACLDLTSQDQPDEEGTWMPQWILADVDIRRQAIPIQAIMGMDQVEEWSSPEFVVVEVGPKVEAPT